MKTIVTVLFALLIITSCDKVDDPFDVPHNGGNNTTPEAQKILLEDLTGFRCTNCPQAHDIATNLYNVYGDQLIIVSVHGSAQFSTPSSSGPYSTNFQTPAATHYYTDFFDSPGLPTGAVNRRIISDSRTVAPSAWGEIINPMIQTTAPANLSIDVMSYNEATRVVEVDITMTITSEMASGNYFMTAYLVEDSIYDWQLNNGVDIENYLHRHVLRDNINGTWGDLAFDSGEANQEKTLSYQYTLNEAWKEEHCEIVAYLYHGDTREIVQVNKMWVNTP